MGVRGGQWVGTGSARDVDGIERPVPVVAPREVPEPPDIAQDGEVDRVERLERITGWTQTAKRPDVDWTETESRLGTGLPSDCKRMVETFGEGAFDGFLRLNQEPWTGLHEDGLLTWAGTEHENRYCWRTDGGAPDRWRVVVRSFDGEDVAFDCQAAEFVCRVLTDPRHPFTRAHSFDTHWFMNHRTSD